MRQIAAENPKTLSLKNSRITRKYLAAVCLVISAVVGTKLLLPATEGMIFPLFCTAIAVSTILGGFGPGILATVLAGMTCDYFFLPPAGFAMEKSGVMRLAVLISTGLLISVLGERLHSARLLAERRWEESERTRRRHELLAQIGATLTASVSYELSLKNVALLLSRQFADLCLIDVVQEDGTLRRIAGSYTDLANPQIGEQIARCYPADEKLDYGPGETLRTGRVECLRILSNAPHHALLYQAGFRGLIGVPLQSPERRLGVITFLFLQAARPPDTDDLMLASEIARSLAIRLANENLLWTAQREITRLTLALQQGTQIASPPSEFPAA